MRTPFLTLALAFLCLAVLPTAVLGASGPADHQAQFTRLVRQLADAPLAPVTAKSLPPADNGPVSQPKLRLTGLFVAVAVGDLNKVKGLTPGKSGINGIDTSSGGTPLTWAAQFGDPRIVSWFLNRGAAVDQEDGLHYTALLTAARYGKTDAVRVLLDYGADPDRENGLGQVPLQVACGPESDFETVRVLVERGATVDAANAKGWTALAYAAKYGRMDTALYLLERGANPNGNSQAAYTPLHWAVNNGHKEMAELLIQRGADINAVGERDITPLAWCKSEDMRQMLMDRGAR